jgi:hypothetical protein
MAREACTAALRSQAQVSLVCCRQADTSSRSDTGHRRGPQRTAELCRRSWGGRKARCSCMRAGRTTRTRRPCRPSRWCRRAHRRLRFRRHRRLFRLHRQRSTHRRRPGRGWRSIHTLLPPTTIERRRSPACHAHQGASCMPCRLRAGFPSLTLPHRRARAGFVGGAPQETEEPSEAAETTGLNVRNDQKVQDGTGSVTLRTAESVAEAFGIDFVDCSAANEPLVMDRWARDSIGVTSAIVLLSTFGLDWAHLAWSRLDGVCSSTALREANRRTRVSSKLDPKPP